MIDGGTERSAADEHPISPGQRALWLIHQRDPAGAGAAYTIAAAGHLGSSTDPGALRGAFDALVCRHPALRTVLPLGSGAGDEEPVQRVQAPDAVLASYFETVDASGWSEAEVPERLAELAYRPFDLERGPLFRVVLAEAGARPDGGRDRYVLLTLHHVVGDLWSLAVVVRELGKAYRALSDGREAEVDLPELPTTHGEWVTRRRTLLDGEEGERLRRFWRDRLRGGEGLTAVRPLDLPTDRPRPALQSFDGGTVARGLEPLPADGADGPGGVPGKPVLRRALGKLARSCGTNRFSVLMAAWQAVLGRWSGQDEFLVGSPTAGRGGARSELGNLVGYFVNPVAVRAPLAGDPTFSELVTRVGEETAAVLAHQDLPFPWIAEELAERDPSRTPLFQTMMVLQKSPIPGLKGLGAFALGREGSPLHLDGLEIESVPLPQRGAQFDLTLFVTEEEGALVGSLEYASALFDRATAERLLGHLATFLEGAVADPERPISRIPMLTPNEERQVGADWPAGGHAPTAGGEPTIPLHERVLRQAAARPEAEALVVGEERLTYGDLDRRSGRLAAGLRALGVGPEVPVGVFLERTADLPVALLAVLRAGGAYVPMDPAYPEERVALMAGDSGMTVAVAGEELAARLPAGVRGVTPAELEAGGRAAPAGSSPVTVSPDALAYVIYTSGSTGRPKGVAITHRSASALVEWAAKTFDRDELSGVLAATSVCFDLSVFELFVPLALGGRVILASDALALPSLPAADAVRLVNTVPSAMEGLCRVEDGEGSTEAGLPPGVRTVCLAGEVLRRRLVDAVYRASAAAGGEPGVERVLNLYGPSEDTTYSTEALCPATGDGEPTIGRVLPGGRGYVVDARLGLQPQGVPGELLLGGVGLARGYLGRPALTAERFIPDPFVTEASPQGRPGGRLYRTGDLVRWLPGGELELVGRLDHQVKVRGFRIELGEVEAALGGLSGVRDGVVAVRGEGAERRLVAYVVPGEGEEASSTELRSALGRRLPGYMVPDLFVTLDALPRTPNGKVDRRALPEPPGDRSGSAVEYVEPETEIELLLAGIWCEVLGVQQVGIYDSFFELGGHSLAAHRVLVRLRDVLGVEVPVSRLFEDPTISGLAHAIAEVLLEGADEETVAEVLGSAE